MYTLPFLLRFDNSHFCKPIKTSITNMKHLKGHRKNASTEKAKKKKSCDVLI